MVIDQGLTVAQVIKDMNIGERPLSGAGLNNIGQNGRATRHRQTHYRRTTIGWFSAWTHLMIFN